MSEMKHVERLLRKVKLNSSGTADLEWKDYYVNEETHERCHNDVKHPGAILVHEDLSKAFAPLNEHWLIRGEEVTDPKGNYPFDATLKKLDRITVTSVTFSGGEPVPVGVEEDRSPIAVHIQGTYRLNGGGAKNYCLPAIKLHAPQEKYRFQAVLANHVAAVEREAMEYVAGKCTPPAQQAIDFPAATDDGSADQAIEGIGSADDEEDPTDEVKERLARANSTPVD